MTIEHIVRTSKSTSLKSKSQNVTILGHIIERKKKKNHHRRQCTYITIDLEKQTELNAHKRTKSTRGF